MSGAKNCPETPRQKMIGMMYLVLTAMLALNVSADIINGFAKLRHSMESSMESTQVRTEDIMMNFEVAYNKDEASKVKYGDWYEVAKAIHAKSEEFYNYVENFKLDIANLVDGPKEPYKEMPEKLKGGSDTNKAHMYAFNMTDPQSGLTNAEEFKHRMQDYVQYMTSADSKCILERMDQPKFQHEWEQKTNMFKALFNTDDVYDEAEKQNISWEASVFHEMPAAAVAAMLVKYQNDIRTAEYDMVNFMFSQTSTSTFIANVVTPVVLPTNGEYIMQGQRYRAKIVSAMMDTNQVPVVYINGQQIEDGIYEVPANSVGQQTFNGYMLVGDDTTHYAFTGQYTVGAPSATISNTDLTVMYRDYDNPFSISVPGVSSDKLRVNCPGASVTKKGDRWIIRPSEASKEVTISVAAEVDGKTTQMGSMLYRVRPLPKPGAYFRSSDKEYQEGNIARAALLNPSATVIASYGPEGLLNLNYTVTGFKVRINGILTPSESNKFTKAQLDQLGKLKKGADVIITDIRAKGPSGKEVRLSPIALSLN